MCLTIASSPLFPPRIVRRTTVLVRIGFIELDPRILPDMGVTVTFLTEKEDKPAANTRPMTLAPKAEIKTDGNASYGFIQRGDLVELHVVQTGGAGGDRVEIRAGLQGGDRMLVSPPAVLTDGVRVIVRSRFFARLQAGAVRKPDR